MDKATLEQLNTLHGYVAQELTEQVKGGDMKAIEKAIAFLKNNNVTADHVTSKETKSLFTSIEEMKVEKEGVPRMTVDDILAQYTT